MCSWDILDFWHFRMIFFWNFVFPGLFGHNWGPLKKKKNENILFCRLGKSTSIRAIDLAVQLIVSRRVHVHPHPLSTVHPTYLLKLLPSSQFKVYSFTHFLCNISPSNYITCLHLCKYMPSTAQPIVQNIVLFSPVWLGVPKQVTLNLTFITFIGIGNGLSGQS